MIETLSLKIATVIKAKAPDHPASVNVLKYSVSFLLNTVSIVLLAIVTAFITGKVEETFIALISFALLRQVSGGYHLKSGMLCITVSTGVIILLSFSTFSTAVNHLLLALAFILSLIYAPAQIEKQTRIPLRLREKVIWGRPAYYFILKVISLLLILLGYFYGNSVIAASFFVQAVLLIHKRR
ncbi:accessory gene regulator B family protein [Paenibacillus sp. R14(2021)]|uniref:accessory gene regulator B family protein n=1 Tax=Paenibacillus sp. R14(2021) TaxID=2859228 RepID=UPI001C61451A|nr:accessory gene regulator B family protein [Paenibacillus sp. R14(2021)]